MTFDRVLTSINSVQAMLALTASAHPSALSVKTCYKEELLMWHSMSSAELADMDPRILFSMISGNLWRMCRQCVPDSHFRPRLFERLGQLPQPVRRTRNSLPIFLRREMYTPFARGRKKYVGPGTHCLRIWRGKCSVDITCTVSDKKASFSSATINFLSCIFDFEG